MGGNMAKDYSKKFYNSSAWKRLSEYIRVSRHFTCEECGEYGTQVHHIKEITPENINDASICHNKKRKKEADVNHGLKFDSNGDLISVDTPLFKK